MAQTTGKQRPGEFAAKIRDMLTMPSAAGHGRTRLSEVVDTLYELATVEKNVEAIKVILDRTAGKVKDILEISERKIEKWVVEIETVDTIDAAVEQKKIEGKENE